jgi:hypothetical protein
MRATRQDPLDSDQLKALLDALILFVVQEEVAIRPLTRKLTLRALEASLKRTKGNLEQASKTIGMSRALAVYYLKSKEGRLDG